MANEPSETDLKNIKNIFRSLLKKTGGLGSNHLNKAQGELSKTLGTRRVNQLSRFPQPPSS